MRIRPICFSSIKQITSLSFAIFLFHAFTACCALRAEENAEYIMIKVISRPIAKKNEVIPRNTKGARHLAIVSEIFPHGIWEMGPDAKGMIATTNTVGNLSEWHTHQVTQKCIELGGDYVHFTEVEVNKQGLLDVIKQYENSLAGKHKYSFRSYNENWAVEKAIYGAGGDLSRKSLQKDKVR